MLVRAVAPAKLIFFGEHFVVYGADALAAAINRYVSVEISSYKKNVVSIISENLPFLKFGVQLDMQMDTNEDMRLNNYVGSSTKNVKNGGRKREASSVSSTASSTASSSADASDVLIYVREAVEQMRRKYDIAGGFRIKIKSDVPLSAGLGSSAATSVATIAALKAYFGIDSDVEETRKEAREVERAVQGAASPIDTAVSTYGGFIHVRGEEVSILSEELRKEHEEHEEHKEHEKNERHGSAKREKKEERDEKRGEEIGLLVAISNSVSLDKMPELRLKTKHLVARVRERKEKLPSVFSHLLSTASEITREGIKALKARDMQTLGTLFFVNHGLLEAIGVVPRKLSAFVSSARCAGAIGAKVTGAGGSDDLGVGSVLVLPPEERDAIMRIEGALVAEGANVMHVKAGVSGLKVERLK